MSLLGLVAYTDIPITVMNEKLGSPAVNRNSLIKRALNGPEITHVLFLDDDHCFPMNLLERLLSWDKNIVGVAYARKGFDKDSGVPLTNIVDPEDEAEIATLDPSVDLQKVGSVGAGTLLIKRTVLETLQNPYFYEVLNRDGTRVGEDVYFCRKALSYGYDIWVDTALSLSGGHIGEFEYRLNKVVKI